MFIKGILKFLAPLPPALLMLALAGCGAPATPQTDPRTSRDLLGFLQPGHTAQEAVRMKLGTPAATFEQNRIWTYWILGDRKENDFMVLPKTNYPGWGWEHHNSLVLVFDAHGILQKQNLVSVQCLGIRLSDAEAGKPAPPSPTRPGPEK
jgi:hypothetical protein